MATLRELFMKITIDPKGAVDGLDAVDDAADKTEKNLKDVDKQALKVGETFKEFGSRAATGAKVAATAFAGAATAVGLFFAKWADHATQVDRASKAYGVSAGTLQELSFAAEKLGGEGDAVIEVFKEMSIRITEMAETGSGPAADALTYLKLKATDLKRLKPEEQFDVLADALASVSDEGAKFFLKDSLFGEEGAIKIGTLLDKGSKGIAEMRKEARELGVVLSEDAIKKGIEFRGTLFTIGKTIEGVANQIAVKMLPFVKQLADKLLAWGQANKDLIASRLESFIEQLVKLTTQLIPLLSDVLGGIVQVTEAVGGMDKALAIAAGGWAAWQIAALAAIGPVGQAIAALGAGVAAGTYLANRFRKSREQDRYLASEDDNEKFARFAKRALDESNLEPTYDPSIDAAREKLKAAVIEDDKFRVFSPNEITTPSIAKRRKQSLDRLKRLEDELQAAYDADAAHAAEVNANSNTFVPGKATKPGEKPITLDALIKEARKESLTLERYREIRKQLEAKLMENGISSREEIATAMRAGADSPAGKAARERLIIESALKGVNQKLGQAGETQNLNDLIASAVGQGTGLGASRLQPAGLGTTINHIDASVKFEVGGVTVEVPAGMAAAYSGAVKLGGDLGEAMRDALQPMLDNAFRAQRGQIIG